MHRMPAYERYVRAFDRFDQAEGWADRLLCLPCHAALTEEDLGGRYHRRGYSRRVNSNSFLVLSRHLWDIGVEQLRPAI